MWAAAISLNGFYQAVSTVAIEITKVTATGQLDTAIKCIERIARSTILFRFVSFRFASLENIKCVLMSRTQAKRANERTAAKKNK